MIFYAITFQYLELKKPIERDTLSQLSQESSDSREPPLFAPGDIRRRLSESLHDPRPFTHDPKDPSAAALKVFIIFMLPTEMLMTLFLFTDFD